MPKASPDRASAQPIATHPQPQPAVAEAAPLDERVRDAATDQRRRAPEQRAADAEARAAALDAAAARFKEGGFEDRAKLLSDEAAAIRKKEAQTPSPGCRLDMLVDFIDRAERRAAKADEAVTAAEAALDAALTARTAAHREVEESKAQLLQLRAGLSKPASETVMDTGTEAPETTELSAMKQQLAEVAAQLASVVSERDSLRAAAPPGPVAPGADLPTEVPMLETEVSRLQSALNTALAAADVEAYDAAATQHARVASALARALRQRQRTA